MTPDAQALAPALARLNEDDGHDGAWLPDATTALNWVAANLHAEGDVGDALRERLGLWWEGDVRTAHHRLVGLWEPLP